MKVNQDELLKAISILSKNPEYIKLINEGKLNKVEPKEDNGFICKEFTVPANTVDEFNSFLKELSSCWSEKPKSFDGYHLEVGCFNPDTSGDSPTYVLSMSIRTPDDTPIYYNEFDYYSGNAKFSNFNHNEYLLQLDEDTNEILDELDELFSKGISILLGNDYTIE